MTNGPMPALVQMITHSDERGSVLHYGDLVLGSAKRVYFIEPKLSEGFRGWHGHKYEGKIFRCLEGSVKISSVKVDDWEFGKSSGPVHSWTLSAEGGELLVVPNGYANGILPLEENCRVMVLSNRTLQESKDDDIRFDEATFS